MVPALTQPTRSYIDGTPTQRRLGFVAASIFSATYVIAPVYLLITGVTLVRAKRPLSRDVWLLTLPLIASAMLPAKLLPKFGRWLLQTKFMSCVPYYFDYEEFHEITVLTQCRKTSSSRRWRRRDDASPRPRLHDHTRVDASRASLAAASRRRRARGALERYITHPYPSARTRGPSRRGRRGGPGLARGCRPAAPRDLSPPVGGERAAASAARSRSASTCRPRRGSRGRARARPLRRRPQVLMIFRMVFMRVARGRRNPTARIGL